MDQTVQQDIEAIISRQYDHGADLWSTPDHKLLKGAPFTTLECPHYLLELGMSPEENLLKETAALIFQGWREDGRFKISPSGGFIPVIQRWLCERCVLLVTQGTRGYNRPFTIFLILRKQMAAGSAINTVLVAARRPAIQPR